MNKLVILVKLVLPGCRTYVALPKPEEVHLLGDHRPHSNVKFSLVHQHGTFDILLQNECLKACLFLLL